MAASSDQAIEHPQERLRFPAIPECSAHMNIRTSVRHVQAEIAQHAVKLGPRGWIAAKVHLDSNVFAITGLHPDRAELSVQRQASGRRNRRRLSHPVFD